ncbi:class I SAM-dependent methyltransferase [Neobacillus sp. DY30]|uniref:class I SAM-dependent DNA methyltransferase n=1 Tax=Neobacillus sp. DY30 TaxID=3047871 RepID=UPI0024BF31D2|nr:class I SAM-dependent methyltransferase [Neobacillus sp. DY30]WHX99405.1 methyltransferase domain-containing protein [Neobacillus sp. DY30]
MGLEFLDIFEQWADSYDESVGGNNREYKAVFAGYEHILEDVAVQSMGNVVEFGVGTGNLTKKLLVNGLNVIGIEPSTQMREIAAAKLGLNAIIFDGDFLHFPKIMNVNTIVSTYAFHHLTDKEKEEAIAKYGKLLSKGGRIVFADTMFETVEDYNNAIVKAREQGFHNLAKDLETEYYTTIPILRTILNKSGFTVLFRRCNEFVWLMEGEKQ